MNVSQLHEYATKLEQEGFFNDEKALAALPAGAKASPQEIIGKVCGIYQKVRPFLDIISNLFFIPAKWRKVIQTFMVFMDGLCPGTEIPS